VGAEELAEGLPAAESYPRPITGITGGGYVWTAGRALRALSFGLFGLSPVEDGLEVEPHLPSAWERMTLAHLPLRGHTLTIEVRAGAKLDTLNGRPWVAKPVVEASALASGENRLVLPR